MKTETRAKTEDRSRYIVQSVARGLAVLDCFLDESGGLRLTDLAEKLAVDKATLFRYCITLEDAGYLDYEASTRQYKLGPRLRELGLAARRHSDMLTVIRTWLPVIAQRYQGTASFGILAGLEVIYVDRAVTEGSLGYSLSIGARLSVGLSSIGKVLVANLPGAAAEQVFAQLAKGERKSFEKGVKEAVMKGYALNVGASRPGVNSVAVAIRDVSSGQIAGGLNVAGPESDFAPKRLVDEIGPALMRAADRIEHNELADPNF
jgi:IclR family pca regulon transcriptional regulator